VQLQAAHQAGVDEPAGLADGDWTARGIDADERYRDVGVRRRERQDFVVRDLLPAGQSFVHREHDAGDLARAIVVGERRGVPPDTRDAEVLPRRRIRRGRLRRLEVDVDVDGG
jgi:hypothetical protein